MFTAAKTLAVEAGGSDAEKIKARDLCFK